jgi:hypothetical protein
MNDTSEDLISIASFPEPAGASLAQSALEAAGIESYLQGGMANSLIPLAFTARLQVKRSDEAAAREVLEAAEISPESLEAVTAAEIANEFEPK